MYYFPIPHLNFFQHHTQSVLFRNPNDCGPTPFDKNRFLLHDSLRIAEKNTPAFPVTFVLPGVQDNKIIEEKPDKNNNSADPPPDCKEGKFKLLYSMVASKIILEDNFVVKDIWEAALTLKIPQRKTWECFGLQVANTEKPFITELSLEKSQLWISCYHAYENQINVMDKSLLSDLSIIPYQTFIKHLKYLLSKYQVISPFFLLDNVFCSRNFFKDFPNERGGSIRIKTRHYCPWLLY